MAKSPEEKRQEAQISNAYIEAQISNVMEELFAELTEDEKAEDFNIIKTNIYPNPYGALLNRKWTLDKVLYEYLWMYFYLDTMSGNSILFKKELTVMRGYSHAKFSEWYNSFSQYSEEDSKMCKKEKLMRKLLTDVYPLLQDKFESRVIKTSAIGKIKGNIATLILTNYHGYINSNSISNGQLTVTNVPAEKGELEKKALENPKVLELLKQLGEEE